MFLSFFFELVPKCFSNTKVCNSKNNQGNSCFYLLVTNPSVTVQKEQLGHELCSTDLSSLRPFMQFTKKNSKNQYNSGGILSPVTYFSRRRKKAWVHQVQICLLLYSQMLPKYRSKRILFPTGGKFRSSLGSTKSYWQLVHL